MGGVLREGLWGGGVALRPLRTIADLAGLCGLAGDYGGSDGMYVKYETISVEMAR